ncbi:MAG TPA: HXXEE domain-containing protein, partial [Longimicrobiaceae bacterium]|nr:HXXEE domain-containing protein [Longimicrobiaceae bacterium]
LVLLSLLAFLLAGFVVMRPASRVALWLLLALEATVAINVVAHVLSALVVFKGYGPGLASALTLNAPFAWYVLRRARNEAWVTRRAWRSLILGGMMLHGPVLVAGLWLAAALGA